MGYWSTNEQGHSFTEAESGEDLIWGDQPADIIDAAISEIKAVFLHDIGRLPSVAEMRAGFAFSSHIEEDLPQVPSQAKEMSPSQAEVISKHVTDALRWDEPSSTPKQRNAWQHIRGVFEALKPEKVEVPDSPADLGGPF
jgi:hypothetical protein